MGSCARHSQPTCSYEEQVRLRASLTTDGSISFETAISMCDTGGMLAVRSKFYVCPVLRPGSKAARRISQTSTTMHGTLVKARSGTD